MQLSAPITDGGRIFKMYANRLANLSITTFNDLLWHIPFRYEDYSLVSTISRAQPGEIVTIKGTVSAIKNQYTKSFKTLQRMTVIDDTGSIDVLWFNQPYLTKQIKTGDTISIAGKVEQEKQKPIMYSPDFEITTGELIHTGRLVPVYPETKGVSSKWLRRQIYGLLQRESYQLVDYLPQEITKQHNFPDLLTALKHIHFPTTREEADKARERLSFDELFMLQLKAQQKRATWKASIKGHVFKPYEKDLQKFIDSLPFKLTDAQQAVINDIISDVQQDEPMNRLVQGDVGSGKTVVAAVAMYLAHLNGYQSVLMAPTEILAQQHYQTAKKLLEPFGVTVNLATSSSKNYVSRIKNKKEKIHDTKYILHDTDILVGTHAVLSDKIHFEKLGLVVIDEQQRFGVEQRSIIREKGSNPHFLTMTATPIPRTVALTMYGDLDLSYINQMPKGRQTIKTWLVPTIKREDAYRWIEKEINEHDSQVFIVCPFIEESENMTTVKAAAVEFERLQKDVFPDLKLALLHGKLKAKEKDAILADFRDKKASILVATPVVEVGIDIPNATIIVIEAAERFGLAQLHQLRGRVGRGDKQSYCLLFTESPNPATLHRLKAMETMHSGAELAELDLKLRGAGDIFGTAQHGMPKLKVASFSDTELIAKARKQAETLFKNLSKYPALEHKLNETSIQTINPD